MNIYLYYSKNCLRKGYVGRTKMQIEMRKYLHDHQPCRGSRVIRELGDTEIKLLKIVNEDEGKYWEGRFIKLYGNCNVNMPGRTSLQLNKTPFMCNKCEKITTLGNRFNHNRRCTPVC